MSVRIGILSDTHDLLRPGVREILEGCALLLHAGDLSGPALLETLNGIAPVLAVRGNADKGEWAQKLPLCLETEAAGVKICMAHKKKDLPEDLSGFDLAVCGHTHRYSAVWTDHTGGKRTLGLNPGSCGPRRLLQPITLAVLRIAPDGWTVTRKEIPHSPGEAPMVPKDLREQIETVIRETQKGRSAGEIARRHGMEEALAEQIARLYLTHPGVTADGIMTKMGL